MKNMCLFVLMGLILMTSTVFGAEYNVELYLVNEYNDPISGAVLDVVDVSGDSVYTGVSNSDGSVDIFTLEESSDNYTISFSHDEFTIDDTNSTLTSNVNLTIRGDPLIGSYKFFVLESDDWLSYAFWETRNMETWQNLSSLGFTMDRWKNDTVETENDLDALFVVLEKYDVVISPGIITCMPDFDAIYANGYTEYICDDISDGVPDYLTENVDGRDGLLAKHMEGYQSGFWMPTYHGQTHTNTDEWLTALQEGDTDAIQGFENKVIRTNSSYQLKSEYNRQGGMVDQFSYAKQNQSIVEGMQHFENMFGFVPKTHSAAPNYRADLTTLEVLKDNGFIGIRNTIGYYNSTSSSRIAVSIGDVNQNHSISVLDVADVVSDWYYQAAGYAGHEDAVQAAKDQVDIAFVSGSGQHVDLTHRLNYVSEIFGTDWRDQHLAMLDEFLEWMVEEHPTTQYLTSYELHQIQKYGYSIQPWYNKTIVRNYLQVDKEVTVGASDVQTGSGWTNAVVAVDLTTGSRIKMASSSIVFTSEAGHSYEITNALSSDTADGTTCSSGVECSSGNCVHEVCRATNPFCGDGFCDAGESCGGCAIDCGTCSGGYTQCMDGIDNDGDGKIDMADKGCVDRNDNDESDEPGSHEEKKQEKKNIKLVTKGEKTKFDVSKYNTAVKTIDIVSNEDADDVEITVVTYEVVPESIATAMAVGTVDDVEAGYDIYQYLEIEADVDIESAVITFEIPVEEVDVNSVVLLHYDGGKWEELSTEFIIESNGNFIFEAETTGFSVFAVGVKAAGFSYMWLLVGAVLLGGAFVIKK
jgi:PGF-pre-PGF domain-containing protein